MVLGFPDYYGENWDALVDCMRDLSWLEPVQVVLVHEDQPLSTDRAGQRTYLSILHRAVLSWTTKPEHDLVVVFPVAHEAEIRALLPEL